MKTIHQLRTRCLMILSLSISLSVHAASLTWDITDSNDQTINDGAGTWNTSNALWNDATLNSTNVVWSNTVNVGDTAVIGGGGTPGDITLGSDISVGALLFKNVLTTGTQVYEIEGSGQTLTIANGGTISIENGSNTSSLNISVKPKLVCTNLVLQKATSGNNGFIRFYGDNSGLGGTLTLASASGGVILSVFGSKSLGASQVTVASGSTLDLRVDGTFTNAITIAGTGLGNRGAIRFFNSFVNTFTGGITLSGNANIQTEANAVSTISGGIDGAYNIGKISTGTLRLSATNTYAGSTTITDGTLEAAVLANGGSDSSIGKSANTADKLVFGAATATLRYIGAADVITDRGFTFSSGTGGGATIESSGTGTLTLDNTVSIAYGTADQTRILTLGGTNVGANTFAKMISSNGTAAVSLTKAGTGRWVLSGDNSYPGTTTVNAGALRITHSNALGTTAGTTLIGTTSGSIATLEVTGGISVGEALVVRGYGTAADADKIVNVSGNNTLAGNLSIYTGGTCYGFRSDADKLTISGNIARDNATGTRTFYLRGAGDGEISGTISGGGGTPAYAPTLIKEGTGTWTLSGVNTYSGTTTVSNGTLAVGCDLALKAGNALTLSGGTFDAGSFSNSLGTLTLSTGSSNTLAVASGTCKLSFSGLSDSGTLKITGTLAPTTLRFGTSSSALTPEQRAQITTTNGRKIGLDANGYVFAIPPGAMVSFF